MTAKIPITFFAPPEREPLEVIQRQAGNLDRSPVTRTLLNAMVNYLFVLNSRRQIVMASENVLELMPGRTMNQIIGLRPGEALGCIHAYDCQSGCGTSQFCRQCGVVRVILSGLNGSRDVEECRMTRFIGGKEETLPLQVFATPLAHHHEHYTLLTVAKIENERR